MVEVSTGAWPMAISGIVESVVSTQAPDGDWSVAALGLHGEADHTPDDPLRARTWGNTRTKRNLARRGTGHVQFVDDPLDFVEAALGRWEAPDPIVDRAAAWTEVRAERVESGESRGTTWIEWELRPMESTVEHRSVPHPSRGFGAILEMTVAASRLGVPGYDDDRLRRRLEEYSDIVRRCGGVRELHALDRIDTLTEWDPDTADAEHQ